MLRKRSSISITVKSSIPFLLRLATLVAGAAPVLVGQNGDQGRSAGELHSTTVISLGQVSATQLAEGLGIGIGPNGLTQDWQFATAKAMGASWVRIQCSWNNVEKQSEAPQNKPANPRFVQFPACVSALTSAAKYGLHVTEVAAFGPPFHQLVYVTLPAGASAGQTSLQVEYFAGVNGSTLANLRPISDYVCPIFLNDNGLAGNPYRCLGGLSAVGSPPGTLITGVHAVDAQHSTLDLASAVTKALPANVNSPRNCSMVSGSNTLNCASAGFDSSWVGDVQISVPGAGSKGAVLTTYVTAVPSTAQLTLRIAAATSVSSTAVRANRLYAIGEILYPSTGTDRPDDPSVVAYGDYATFLAKDMAARGVSGDIEIWNEPPWRGDSWDFRPGLYDNANSGPYKPAAIYRKGAVVTEGSKLYLSQVDGNKGNDPAHSQQYWTSKVPSTVFPGEPISGANFGFAANLQHRHFPPGITATWNGTSGNGFSSLLGPQMQAFSGEQLNQPPTVVTKESIHPYGGALQNPEDVLMRADCLRFAARVQGNIYKNGQNCFLPGQSTSGNLMQSLEYDYIAKQANPEAGLGHSVTETNNPPPAAGFQLQQARSNVRQFLGYEALGVTPIEFFQMWDGHRDPTFSFVDYVDSTVHPLPSYTALAGLMNDLRPLSQAPHNPAGSGMSIQGYSGTYPLGAVNVVGTHPGAKADSQVLIVWQLTAAPGFTGSVSGNTLQVTAMNSGFPTLGPGQLLQGRGVPPGTTISARKTGRGGVGTYTISGKPLSLPTGALNTSWFTQPDPNEGTVTLKVAPGLHVTGALNLVTRKKLSVDSQSGQITMQVRADPIEIFADPL